MNLQEPVCPQANDLEPKLTELFAKDSWSVRGVCCTRADSEGVSRWGGRGRDRGFHASAGAAQELSRVMGGGSFGSSGTGRETEAGLEGSGRVWQGSLGRGGGVVWERRPEVPRRT